MTIATPIVRDIVYTAVGKGAPIRPLCERLGITHAELDETERRFDMEFVDKLWRAAAELSNDPDIALHVGEVANFTGAGIAGFIMQSSPTVLSALKRTASIQSLFSEQVEIRILENPETVEITFEPVMPFLTQFPAAARQSTESSLVFALTGIRKLCGVHFKPVRVGTFFGEPKREAEYERIFGGMIEFGQEKTILVISLEDAALPITSYNPQLLQILEHQALEMLASLHTDTSIAGQVRRLIIEAFPNEYPHLEFIAEKMSMSTRTLQRKIQAEGSSFADIVDNVRREFGIRYITEQADTIAEIAYMLGYAEVSVFSRSFKRWTGKSPTEYRQ